MTTSPPTYDVGLDENWDLPAYTRHVTGTDLILQRVKTRLGTVLGEWMLDTSKGLDFLGWTQIKEPPVEAIEAAVAAEIAGVPGVLQVRSCEGTLSADRRTVTVEADALIEGGEAQVTISGIGPTEGNARPDVVILYRRGGYVP